MSVLSRIAAHVKSCVAKVGSRQVTRSLKRQVRVGGLRLGSVDDLINVSRPPGDERDPVGARSESPSSPGS